MRGPDGLLARRALAWATGLAEPHNSTARR